MANQSAGLKPSLLITIAFVLSLGMGFRLYGLDHKIYWHDEVFTSLRASGYIGSEVARQLINQSVTALDLQQFQQLSPDKTWMDTWMSLKTHPEHPPLFYLLERAWMGIMGSSIAATRGLSALFSILLFPLLAWFCHALSQWQAETSSPTQPHSQQLPTGRVSTDPGRETAAIAILLLAFSPVQVLYAQEAREYSLWACAIVLSSGLLLKALQQPRQRWPWVSYGLVMTLGLYSTLLQVGIIMAHGAFLLWERAWVSLKGWSLATISALTLFLPWLIVIAQESQQLEAVTAWTKVPLPLVAFPKIWALHLSSSFVDLGLPHKHPGNIFFPGLALILLSWVWLNLPPGRAKRFLLCMLVIPALMLIAPDLLWGGKRSSITRYFMPLVLTALTSLAMVMGLGIRSMQRRTRRLNQMLLAVLLSLGVISCGHSAIAPAWWTKSFNFVMPAMADYIAQAQATQPTPVWIELGSNGLGNAIALSHRLPPETPFYLFQRPHFPEAEPPALIPYASGELMEEVQQTYGVSLNIVEAPDVYELWELKP